MATASRCKSITVILRNTDTYKALPSSREELVPPAPIDHPLNNPVDVAPIPQPKDISMQYAPAMSWIGTGACPFG
jgi:hypothetical protein